MNRTGGGACADGSSSADEVQKWLFDDQAEFTDALSLAVVVMTLGLDLL